MTFTVEATYENGTLKLAHPLPLNEHDKVRVIVETATDAVNRVRQTAGIIPCKDPELIEWAAMDPDLEYGSLEDS